MAIIDLGRGENTDISEVFSVKSLEVYACPQELFGVRSSEFAVRSPSPYSLLHSTYSLARGFNE